MSCILGWFAHRIERARRQQAAVDRLTKKGVGVWYDFQVADEGGIWVEWDGKRYVDLRSTEPRWLCDAFKVQSFRPVTRVGAAPGANLVDRDLQKLRELPTIEILILRCPNVTDRGLAELSRLPKLRHLDLFRTPVTDQGLHHLAALENLDYLRLDETLVAPAGIQSLKSNLPNCKIELDAPMSRPREPNQHGKCNQSRCCQSDEHEHPPVDCH
jgi:hypothetical protein